MLAKNRWHPSEELLELLLMFNPKVVDLVKKLEGRKGKGSIRMLYSATVQETRISIGSTRVLP